MKPGDPVKLVVPENSRLDGATARIAALTEWGAYVLTDAAASGQFRALHAEMVPLAGTNGQQERTGSFCDNCGSTDMVRTGTCMTCQSCGTTSGCS